MAEDGSIDAAAVDHRRAVETALDQVLDAVLIGRTVRDEAGNPVDFEVEYANARFVAFTGRNHGAILGRRLLDVYPALRGSEHLTGFFDVVATGKPYAMETIAYETVIDDQHVLRVGDIYVTRFGDGILGVWRDVTDRAVALLDLERHRRQLAEAQRLAALGTFEFDLRTSALFWSDELYRICALDPEVTPITTIPDCIPFIHPDDAARIPDIIAGVTAETAPVREEFRFVRPDGEQRVASVIIDVEFDGDAEVVVMRGTALDVTEQRRYETDLLAHRDALEEAQRLARIGSWYYEVKTNSLRWSTQMFDLFGLDPAAGPPEPRQWDAYVDGASLSHVRAARRKAIADGRPFVYDAPMLRAAGEEWIGSVIGEPVLDDGGTILGVRGTVQDITHLRRTEEALSASRAALAAERHTVELLQQSALPIALPALDELVLAAHYNSTDVGVIGGDWYDAFVPKEGSVVLMVGDVAGHGLTAAAVMAQLRNAMRAYVFARDDPAAVCTMLDALVHELYPGEMATAVLASYDLRTHELRWARAGHPLPLLARGDGVLALDGADGLPLGAGRTDAVPYTTGHVVLDPGDCLMLYSDGLIERPGRPFDDGFDRVKTVLQQARAAELPAVLSALLTAVPGETIDDRCVLLARRSK
jgi:serine phosphatase RsbU (regulator of sigma subunit)